MDNTFDKQKKIVFKKEFIPFVGRKAELAFLHELFDVMMENNIPKIIYIEGDFGIGKTTLIEKFLNEISEKYSSILIGKGVCVGETEMNGLTPFHQILETISKQGILQKIIQSDWMKFLKDAAPAWLDIFTGGILGAVKATFDSGKQLSAGGYNQDQVFLQFSHIITKLSEKKTLLFFLDDLQWADASSLELLAYLSGILKDKKILFLCAYRPEAKVNSLNSDRFNEVYHRILCNENHRELQLRAGVDVIDYINQKYRYHDFPIEFITKIQKRTEGHPLFISQLLSLLEETGIIVSFYNGSSKIWSLSSESKPELKLPKSLQVVLEQRLRIMGHELRKIASSASVEGENFTAQIVAKISKGEGDIYDHLESLERNYCLVTEQGTKELGKIVIDRYKFIHRFFRDYIYHTLNTGKKRNLHRSVGECMETLYSDNLYPIAGQLALHFREAHLLQKSSEYALMAAQFEQSRCAWIEAENWCELGLKLLNKLEPNNEIRKLQFVLKMQSGKGYYKSGKYKKSNHRYKSALKLSHELIDKPEWIAEVYFELSGTCDGLGRFDEMIKFLKRAHRALKKKDGIIPYNELHLKIEWFSHAINQWYLGKSKDAIKSLQILLLKAEQLPKTSSLEMITERIYHTLAHSYMRLNNYDKAYEYRYKAFKIADKYDEKAAITYNLNNIAEIYCRLGKFKKGLEYTSQNIETAKQIGNTEIEQFTKAIAGRLLLNMGNFSEALSTLKESESLAEKNCVKSSVPRIYADMALCYLALKNVQMSNHYAVNSLSVAKETQAIGYLGYAYDTLGQVESFKKNWKKAAFNFNKSISIHKDMGDNHFTARTQYHFANSLIENGKNDNAHELLKQALDTFNTLKLYHESSKIQDILQKQCMTHR
ncbi:MAG: AAA family ATPase [Desulfobacterales bacterium]|nr:AAA family ATPase [Desulfobacterales bacterium]